MKDESTRIYQFTVTEEYQVVVPVEEPGSAGEVLYAASGVLQGRSWTPVRVELSRNERTGQIDPYADMPAMIAGGMLAFRADALLEFRSALAPYGEELALDCADADLVAFNVTHKIDALDEERSEVTRFKSDGRIMFVDEYVFTAEKLPEFAVFQIPQLPFTLMCTAGVAELFDEVKPTGTRLALLWESS